MKLKIPYFFLIAACVLGVYSCQKEVSEAPSAIKDSIKTTCPFIGSDIVQKWSNIDIQTDAYDAQGILKSTTYITPGGSLQLSADSNYNFTVPGLTANGKWKISNACKLSLQISLAGTKTFDILKLTKDSLTIRYKEGANVYTHHYKQYSCNYSSALQKKWVNTVIVAEVFNQAHSAVISRSFSYPTGFFQINNDGSYNVVSENVPLNGKWKINDSNCNLVLDERTSLERSFEILKATADSLVIRRTEGNVVYTQKYKLFACPDITKLQKRWDNTIIRTDYIFNNIITGSYVSYPIGYFELFSNKTYNVMSNGVPLSGQWKLNEGCQLVLDAQTYNERTFDVLKLTNDSLKIYRKDLSQSIALTQEYIKH